MFYKLYFLHFCVLKCDCLAMFFSHYFNIGNTWRFLFLPNTVLGRISNDCFTNMSFSYIFNHILINGSVFVNVLFDLVKLQQGAVTKLFRLVTNYEIVSKIEQFCIMWYVNLWYLTNMCSADAVQISFNGLYFCRHLICACTIWIMTLDLICLRF